MNKGFDSAVHQEESQFRKITSSIPVAIFQTNRLGEYTNVNDQWMKYSGLGFDEALGQGWIQSLHPEDKDRVLAEWQKALSTGTQFRTELRFRDKNEKVTWLIAEAGALHDKKKNVSGFVGTAIDITQHKKVELFLEAQKKTLEMIANGDRLEEILKNVTLNYEASIPEAFCTILLLDKEGRHLRHGAAPSLPARFIKAIDGEPIGPVAGSCGTAAHRKQQVIVSDIAQDPLWVNYRDIALANGLKACWSTPILDQTAKVLATFAIYYTEPRLPLPDDLAMIAQMANHVKIVLINHYREMTLKETEEKYSATLERITDGFVALDKNFCYTFVNKKAAVLSNSTLGEMIGKNIWELFPGVIGTAFHNTYNQSVEEQKQISFEQYYPAFDIWMIIDFYPSSNGMSMYIKDITDVKKGELVIKEKANFIESIINASPDIIYVYDIEELKNVYINDGIQTNLGYSDAEIKEMGSGVIPTLMHPKDFENYLQYTYPQYAKLSDGELHVHEYRMKDKTGNWHWLRSKESIFLRQPDGTPKQIFGISNDVTEQKSAENALRLSEERYKAYVEQAADPLFVHDYSGRFVEVNPQACLSLGYTKEELLSLNLFDIELDFDLASAQAAGSRFKPDEHFTLMGHQKRKDGTVFPVEASFGCFDLDGERHFIVQARDISERIKAQETSVANEQQLELIYNTSTDAIFLIEVEDGRLFKFTSVNNGFLATTGLNEEQILGKYIDEVIPEPSLSVVIRNYQKAIAGKKQIQWEETSKYPAGTKTGIVSVNPIFDDKGKCTKLVGVVHDITDRKKAETKLQESESYLRTILDNEPECVKVLNRRGELLSMNPAGLSMIEADSELQVLGRRMVDLVDEKYRSGFNQLSKNVFRGRSGVFEFESTGLRGGHRWLATHAVPLKDIQGNITSLLGVTRDITEQKRSEILVRESEEKYRNLVERAADGIIQINEQGKIILANGFLCRMLQYTESELLKLSIEDTYAHEEKHLVRQRMAEVKNKGSILYERRMVRKDGTEIPVDVVLAKTGQHGFLAIIRDITERKKSEEAVRQSEERFKAAFNASPDSITIASIKTGKLVEVNDGFIDLFGFTREESIGKNSSELGVRDLVNREEVAQFFAKQQAIRNVEGIFYIRAREKRVCLSSIVKLRWKDEDCLLSIIRDVTEIKNTEIELKEVNTKLRELARHLQSIREEERTNIAREIHDELGQQLTGLRMDTSWLAKKIENKEKGVGEKINGMLELIDETVKSVRRISTDLRPGILDDFGLVAALEWQSHEFEKRSGIVSVFRSSEVDLQLDNVTVTALFRVYQESLTNVARHSGASKVESELTVNDGELMLTISDNGKGFSKLEISKNRTLGLVGMRERVLMIGGKIEIDNLPGQGVRVQVTVPLKTAI
ncbi:MULTISPECIES: PAS domain S-box protein [unclassified Imperialibacter]|uniref:PAS domain S-box protein n=1 Tax=unclassified Imperialibacter TaxID=2629706 RepID=UPI001257CEAD|nr:MULTISPECIES: PAS domain S-box protein [unclassified Imperialibacter]CAD5277149.1 conserved hypothetical protein [Imperialibacter sp. 75]CAD5295132.1 conserved hypothetical protein [Imperialibacter sp. 89]VVT12220.1 hypothetical protein IMPR6_20127 [Imperialibacter sp. EC-SDR9]